jgi:hypothetical protein
VFRLADPFAGAPWRCDGIPRERISERHGFLIVECRPGEGFTFTRTP